MSKLVGHSLSHCVADIVAGRVKYKDVGVIVTRTNATTPKEIARLFNTYGEGAWAPYADRALKIARKLLKDRKIDQPRTRGTMPKVTQGGHWTRDGAVVTSEAIEKAAGSVEDRRFILGIIGRRCFTNG